MHNGIRFLKVRITLKQELHPFLLSGCPFVARDHERIAAAGDEFRYGITIAQPLRDKGLILADRLASSLVFLVLLAAFKALLILFLQLLLEELSLFVLGLLFLLLMLEPEFLHGVCNQLLHVESVKGDCDIWEALHHNLMHTFREVHRNLAYLATQVPVNMHDSLYHVLNLGTAYDCHKRTFTAVSVLVGDNSV